MALMLHELCTNSVKYGALSKAEGAVNVGWAMSDNRLRLQWREHGGPPVKSPLKRGFGTNLIEQTVKGEGGTSHMNIGADGLRWEITLPLDAAADSVSGKRNNFANEVSPGPRSTPPLGPEPLRGKRFLVVEDEPMIALDIVAGLESAGVAVEGPVGSVEDALRAIENALIDGALLDANLRGEPVGDIAAALTRRNIPFRLRDRLRPPGLAGEFWPLHDADKALYPGTIAPNRSAACQTGAARPAPAPEPRAPWLTGTHQFNSQCALRFSHAPLTRVCRPAVRRSARSTAATAATRPDRDLASRSEAP